MEAIETLKKLAGRALKPIRAGEQKKAAHEVGAGATLTVRSASFANGGPIPAIHAGDDGIAPAIAWSGVPPETKELALICEDPDAPMPSPFVHWVVLHIPPSMTELPEGTARGGRGAQLAQGKNSARVVGWTGPKPPKGHGVHHYHFQVFALDAPLAAKDEATRDEVVKAMDGHVLAVAEVVGTYENK